MDPNYPSCLTNKHFLYVNFKTKLSNYLSLFGAREELLCRSILPGQAGAGGSIVSNPNRIGGGAAQH